MAYFIVAVVAFAVGIGTGLILRNSLIAFLFKEYTKAKAEVVRLRKGAGAKVAGK
jgi:uncharacterized membrane protein